jgi:hypothetical protein
VEVYLHAFLISEVSGYPHAPAAVVLRKNPSISWVGGWVAPRPGLDGGKKKNPPLLGSSLTTRGLYLKDIARSGGQ